MNNHLEAYEDQYQFIIMNLIYTYMFNIEISEFTYLNKFDDVNELLSQNYKHENCISFNFKFKYNNAKIIKVGRELINFKDKSVDSIFPNEVCRLLKKKFMKEIKNNQSSLTPKLLIKNPNINSNEYIQLLHLNLNIYPSFDMEEIFLFGHLHC